MGKRTHKLRALGNVAEVIAKAPSVAAAARKLGVDRSTIHRWMEAGKAPRPAAQRTRSEDAAKPCETPEAWASRVKRSTDLDDTGQVLLDLAVRALTLARTEKDPRIQLAAMGRYQLLVRQLFAATDEAGAEKPQTPRRETPRQRNVATDPRGLLMAVK